MHRFRVTRAARLWLICSLLLAQALLSAHHLEHAFSGENETCLVCLATPQHSATGQAASLPLHPPVDGFPAIRDIAANTLPPCLLAYASRAPPASIPAV